MRPVSGTTSATVPSATSIEHREQIGLRPRRGPEAARAQHAVDRDDGHEDEADGGEMAEPGKIVAPVRIDDRKRRRQGLVGLMVIDDDDIDAERLRARSSGSMLVVPQSTVTSSVAPRSASARTASTFGP